MKYIYIYVCMLIYAYTCASFTDNGVCFSRWLPLSSVRLSEPTQKYAHTCTLFSLIAPCVLLQGYGLLETHMAKVSMLT